MSGQGDFLDILGLKPPVKTQEDYFSPASLGEIFQAKLAATQASGKDGIRGAKFSQNLDEEIQLIARKVFNKSYLFTTYKERLVSRGHDRNPRQISIPTIRDRLVLRALCELIHRNVAGSTNSTPHLLVNDVVNHLRANKGDYSFVRVDVRDFYPSVKHNLLEKELYHAGLEQSVVELCLKAVRTPTGSAASNADRGIPQGLSISNALAQLYMKRFDAAQQREGTKYCRYVDDILCIVPSDQAEVVLKKIFSALERFPITLDRSRRS